MLQQLQDWFSGNFMAHGYCYLWKPQLVWLHLGSDFLIALSYYSIPLLLIYFVRQRKDLPFQGIFLLFSAFILSCGTTHLAEIWTLWHPDYWLSGLLKAITAIISLYTASELIPLLPKALALPSPAQLEAVNLELEHEITRHKKTVKALEKSQQRLSLLVQQTPLAIIEWNLNSEVSEWNPAAEKLFGYQTNEIIGNNALELMMPGSTKEQLTNLWQSILSSSKGSCNTSEHQTKDGKKIYCEWHNIPLIEPNGTAIGVASLVQNITQREEAQKALRQAKAELEQRVESRTKALAKANKILQAEIGERKQAELALWESKMRLQTVVTQAPIILYATDNQGNITFLEGKGLEDWGEQAEAIINSDFNPYHTELKIAEDLPKIVLNNEQSWVIKVRNSVYQNRTTLTINKDNQVSGLIGVATDITLLHQTQLELAERERYLAALVEIQHQLLAIKGGANYYKAVVNQLGQASRASHVYIFESQVNNNQILKQRAFWQETLNDQETNIENLSYQECIPHWLQKLAKGETIWGFVSDFPESERLILESQGILSLLVLPLIVKQQFFGLIIFDCTEARVWTASEIDLLKAATAALSLQHERSKAESTLRRQESRMRAQTAQLKQTLTQLKQAQVQLVQSEKMSSLGLMVAGIAHEINNPISFVYSNLTPASEYIQQLLLLIQLYQQHYPISTTEIQSYIEEIELNFLMEDLPNLLNSMKAGAERIRDLVLSLRKFSHLDESKIKQVNLHEGIESTLLILKHHLQEKPERPGIEVIKTYGDLPLIHCYPGQLNQVFTHILANAIDALDEQYEKRKQTGSFNSISAPSPQIKIFTEIIDSNQSTEPNSKNVIIRIIDNGSGMTEAVQRMIFDPFFTTKPVGKGTGLGLSISYQIIVVEHGGQLQCLSSPGKGTEFIIQIPIQQSSKKSAHRPKSIKTARLYSNK
jgi:two-component system NtrC family sensor kinase